MTEQRKKAALARLLSILPAVARKLDRAAKRHASQRADEITKLPGAPMKASDLQKSDAVKYLKDVLRETPADMPTAVKEALGEMILRAYLRGREDEAACYAPAGDN